MLLKHRVGITESFANPSLRPDFGHNGEKKFNEIKGPICSLDKSSSPLCATTLSSAKPNPGQETPPSPHVRGSWGFLRSTETEGFAGKGRFRRKVSVGRIPGPIHACISAYFRVIVAAGRVGIG